METVDGYLGGYIQRSVGPISLPQMANQTSEPCELRSLFSGETESEGSQTETQARSLGISSTGHSDSQHLSKWGKWWETAFKNKKCPVPVFPSLQLVLKRQLKLRDKDNTLGPW